MLSYWGRDILLIQKAKTGFNDLSTHTCTQEKKKKSTAKRYKINENHVHTILFPAFN